MATISRAAMTSATVAVHGEGLIVGIGRLQCGSAEWILHVAAEDGSITCASSTPTAAYAEPDRE
jgi:hypothetical protein